MTTLFRSYSRPYALRLINCRSIYGGHVISRRLKPGQNVQQTPFAPVSSFFRLYTTTSESDSKLGSVEPMAFVDRVRQYGIKAILGYLKHKGGMDSKLETMNVVHCEEGVVRAEMKVTREVENAFATLHGGCIALMVDVIGTMAILSKSPTTPGVSVEMSINFIRAAKSGSTVVIEGRLLKAGKRLAFTDTRVYDKETRQLLAFGSHTKAL